MNTGHGAPAGSGAFDAFSSLPGAASPSFAHHWIAYHAAHRPEATAVVHGSEHWSYAELHARASGLASRLQAIGVGPESRVGLFVDRSLEMVAGLIGILSAGAAYVPLDPKLPSARLSFLITDAELNTFVTQRRLASSLPCETSQLLFAEDKDAAPAAPHGDGLRASNLAYVIYTSGSTGVPKGVMVEHRGLSNLTRAALELLDVRSDSRVLQFASLGFDASVFEIFMAFSAGAALHIPAQDAQLPGPALARMLEQQAITHATFLPSTLAALPRSDFSALRVLVSAGEALSQELCARWAPGRRLLNAYGPTEATVWASLHECQACDAVPPIGFALPGVELRVVRPDLSAAHEGQPGELCVLGEGVARGYLNRPELSAQRFLVVDGGARLYRTGDLARRLPDGQFAYLGRIDQQIKLRGFRVEPGEIEAAIAGHPAVQEAVVVARAAPEQKLYAYVVLHQGGSLSATALRALLAQQLPDYMIPHAFVLTTQLPRNSSGKVDRNALPAPDAVRPALESAYVSPTGADEQLLCSVWSDVLNVATVGVQDDFFELGGDSLTAVQILARVRELLGIELPVRTLFQARTVAALARSVASAAEPGRHAPSSLPTAGGAPLPSLSCAQQGIWFLHALDPHSQAYHLPALLRISGPLAIEALAAALDQVARRHEPLHTLYRVRDGLPAVEPSADAVSASTLLHASADDLSDLPRAARDARLSAIRGEELARPFDLAAGPLFRARLVRLSVEEHVLVLTMHHIVADGWSLPVWLRELAGAYHRSRDATAPELPALALRYRDFARWQRQRLARAEYERELTFWKGELAGVPHELALGCHRSRAHVSDFRGGQAAFQLAPGPHEQLKSLCRAEGASLFMGLLAGFALLLRTQGAGDDLLIGTPVAGRVTPALELLIGHFANLIPIRARAADELAFRALLRQVRERALAAYAHQELPFDQLVAALRPERNRRFQPLVQAVLSLQPQPRSQARAGATTFELELLQGESAPFDLSLTLWEQPGGGLAGVLVYSAELFTPGEARALMERYAALLQHASTEPAARVAQLLEASAAPAASTCDELAAALLEQPGVQDCAVRLRTTSAGAFERIAYVVRGAAGTRAQPKTPASLTEVAITAMPLAADGTIDEAALGRIAVVDADLAERCKAQLGALPEVLDAAVVIRGRPARAGRVHVEDLFLAAESTTPKRSVQAASPSDRADTSALPPALADGGALDTLPAAPRTLPELLQRCAQVRDKGIRFVDRQRATTFQSYGALHEAALALLAGLTRQGLGPGDRVILAVDAFERQFEALWACLLGGLIPAQVAPHGAALSKLESTWNLLGRPVILASRSQASPLRALPFGPRVLATEDLVGTAAEARVHAPQPDDVAVFQLTSGSTGTPKCILETHRAILCHIHSAIASNGYAPNDTTLNWLPLDHVVPLLMCHLKDVYVGCDQIHVKTEQFVADPLLWPELVASECVTHTWCPNFGFKLISGAIAASGRAWDLSSIKRFLNGGEQVTLPVVEEFVRVAAPMGFRREAVQTAYGMAEVCTAVTYGAPFAPHGLAHHVLSASLDGALQMAPSASADGETTSFVDVGAPVRGTRLRIVDAEGDLLSERLIGRVQIQSAALMPGYLDDDAANREAFAADGWFNTGDLGFLLGGRLTITGREKEMIIVRGANLYCHEVEDLVNAIPGVAPTFCAACGVEDPEQGSEALAVFFVPQEPGLAAAARVADAIRARLTERLGVCPARVIPLTRSELPKTTSGKIQRAQLKRALAGGDYAQVLRALDLHTASDHTLGDDFHRQIFRRKEAVLERPLSAGACLIFGAGSELAASLRRALDAGGQRAIAIEWGTEFARHDAQRYAVRPGHDGDYAQLWSVLSEPVAAIVHLDAYGRDADGSESLLCLARTLPARTEPPLRLLVVASGAQALAAAEPVAPAKSAMVALLRTLSEESPHLDARHVDLAADAPERNAARVLRELRVLQKDREIAYRAGARLVACLEPVDMIRAPALQPPFVMTGVYLISGGLGGVGELLGRHLLERYRARLVIVGRSSADCAEREAAQRRLRAAAERSGGELLYEPTDCADRAALARLVDRAERRWGRRLDGIVHLAGVMHERLLSSESSAGLAAALWPKMRGAEALGALLAERPGALFIAACSANAYLGGFSVGAYAAANRALAAFVHELRRSGHASSYCVAWSAWEETGMSRERATKDAARAKGYRTLTAREGLLSLLAAVAQGHEQLIVGLERGHPQIERHRGADARALHELSVFYTTRERAAALASGPSVRDRFGNLSQATLRKVAEIPRAGSAEELSSLDAERTSGARRAYAAPQDETERAVVAIWQEVLGADRVDVDDNFFDLGGHSLLLAQVQGRLQVKFARDVPLVDLFRHPSVRALSAHLRGDQAAPSSSLTLQERGRSQRLALAQRRPVQRLKLTNDTDSPAES